MSKARAHEAARLAVQDVNERVATGPSAWAKKLLERQGWSEGKGLGKGEDGMVTHLRVKKKDDNSALGYVKPPDGAVAQDWWAVDPFKAAAGKGATSVVTSGAAVPGVPAGMDAQDFYAGLFAATGGARLGMRARRDQPGKVERAEKNSHKYVKFPLAKVEKKKEKKDASDDEDDDAGAEARAKRARKEERKRRRAARALAAQEEEEVDADADEDAAKAEAKKKLKSSTNQRKE